MKKLGELYISSEIVAFEDISGNFVHISGDSNIGNLHLSGNISIGDSECLGTYSTSFGSKCQSGTNGYTIKNVNKQLSTITVASSKTIPEKIINSLYSVAANGSGYNLGRVLSIKDDGNSEKTLSVDGWGYVLDRDNGTLFFADHPDVGETIIGNYTHSEGYETYAFGACSHAEGGENVAFGKYSHVEGKQNSTTTHYGHAEGQWTQANGYAAHSEGRSTEANGNVSHANGFGTIASTGAFASGVAAKAKDKSSYVWSGVIQYDGNSKHNSTINQYTFSEKYIPSAYYESHGDGTYNINPIDGISGVYIGEDSIPTLIYKYLVESDYSIIMEDVNGRISSQRFFQNGKLKYKQQESTHDTNLKRVLRIGGNYYGMTAKSFINCDKLESVSIPYSMTDFSTNDVFSGCSSLTSIYLPNGINKMGAGIFMGCTSLISANIPNSMTQANLTNASYFKQEFVNCKSLQLIDGSGCSPFTKELVKTYSISSANNWFGGIDRSFEIRCSDGNLNCTVNGGDVTFQDI